MAQRTGQSGGLSLPFPFRVVRVFRGQNLIRTVPMIAASLLLEIPKALSEYLRSAKT